jgi:hypothetical protein
MITVSFCAGVVLGSVSSGMEWWQAWICAFVTLVLLYKLRDDHFMNREDSRR